MTISGKAYGSGHGHAVTDKGKPRSSTYDFQPGSLIELQRSVEVQYLASAWSQSVMDAMAAQTAMSNMYPAPGPFPQVYP